MLIRAMGAQGLGAAFSAVVSLLLLLFLARALGAVAFGAYVAVLSTALLGLILIEGGWPTLVYREGASADADIGSVERLTAQGTMHIVLATLALAGIGALIWAAGLTRWGPALPVAVVCMGAVAMMNLVSARLRARARFGRDAIWQSAGRLLSAGSIVAVAVTWGATPAGVFAAWTLALLLCLAFWGRLYLARPRWPASAYPLALPFVAYEGLLALLIKGDMAVLGASPLAPTALADYAACSRLNEAGLLLFAPVANVLLGRLRQLAADPDAFLRLLHRALGAALGTGAIAVALGLTVGPRLMPLLFGQEFANAGSLLPWLFLALPAMLGNLVLFPAWLAMGRERALVPRLMAAGLLLLLALPIGAYRDGATGAALGLALTQWLLFLACLRPAWPMRARA